MYETFTSAPAIPFWALIPITVACSYLLLRALRITTGRAGRFALIAIWLRIVFDTFFQITADPLVAGLSLNAMLSISTALIGLVMIDPRNISMRWMLPVYGLLSAVMLSHVFNGELKAAFNGIFKTLYLIVLTLAVYEGLRQNGRGRYSRALMWVVVMFVILQATALVLDVKLVNVSDNSVAYSAGYGHEADVAIILAMAFLPVMLATGVAHVWRYIAIVLLMICLLMANYRTVVLPILPFVAFYFCAEALKRWDKRSRPIIGVGVASVGALALFAGAIMAGDRLDDFYSLASNPGKLLRPTASFTTEEKHAASSRAYVWSTYFEKYNNAPPIQKLVGKGTDSWSANVLSSDGEVIGAYPQSEFIGYLHDYGLYGFVALNLFLFNLIWLSYKCDPESRRLLVLFNLMLLLVQISTMPLWLMQGMILYGVVGGYVMDGAARGCRPGRDAGTRSNNAAQRRTHPRIAAQ